MHRPIRSSLLAALLAGAAVPAFAQPSQPAPAASGSVPGSWQVDAPGVVHKITPADLPAPFATASAHASPGVVARPANATLKVPAGFKVEPFATDLEGPRTIRIAPNGDAFVAETNYGRVLLLRAEPGSGKANVTTVFADGLKGPFGIAFYPAGPNPQWVYIAENNRVVRFPYHTGDLKAAGPLEVIVPKLADSTGGHTTRDLAFSPDGKQMFVSVGSASNVAEEVSPKPLPEAQAYDQAHGLGADWGDEANRADVLVFTPEGQDGRIFAAGIRNCAGLGVEPHTGDLWCATNERDGLGDNLVPDYVTRVRDGQFFGWPWWYMGDHEDPRQKGQRPDLRGKVSVPDVLLQSHSAALGISFYPDAPEGPAAFPSEYRGDAFVALHGSWNRSLRTGYKVVRVHLDHGVPSGEYQDFLTGFVVDAASVWGRPVDTAVAQDGSLLVTDDGGGVIWRISPAG
jgi:glucose/arabinose dehydrogenase